MNIDAENPGVGRVVKLIDHTPVRRGPEGSLTQIGPVAKLIDLLLFLGCFHQAVLDLIEQVQIPSNSRSGYSGCGLHLIPPTASQLLKRVRKEINSFLTAMQRDRYIRVNRSNDAPNGAAREANSTRGLSDIFLGD